MAAVVAYGSEQQQQQVREATSNNTNAEPLARFPLRRLVGRDSHGPCEYDVRLMGWIGLDWIGLDWIGYIEIDRNHDEHTHQKHTQTREREHSGS